MEQATSSSKVSEAAVLEAFFDHTELLIAYMDREFRFVRVNEAYARADHLTPAELVGRSHFELYPDAENEEVFRRVLRTGEPYRARAKAFVYADAPARGVTYWDWALVPTVGPDGRVEGLVLSLLDVTERERSLRALRENELRFRALFDESPEAILVVDARTRVPFEANASAARLFRRSIHELTASSLDTLHALRSHTELPAIVERVLRDGRDVHETVVDTLEGPREVLVVARSIRLAARDAIQFSLRDVSEERAARHRVERSLHEKEVLLREVHHRIKNNLQMLSSLLFLQESSLEEPAGRRAFEEARRRILAIALIHQRLYRTGDFARLELATYLKELADQVAVAQSSGTRHVSVVVDVPAVSIAVDGAIPLGLLTNELLCNAFAHAFVGRARGTVRVSGAIHDGKLRLEIGDDGNGLPPDFDLAGGATLGLRMVRALVHQLGATLDVVVDGGTCFVVTAPLS